MTSREVDGWVRGGDQKCLGKLYLWCVRHLWNTTSFLSGFLVDKPTFFPLSVTFLTVRNYKVTPGWGGGVGQYRYVPPESPPSSFRPGPLLKTPLFRPGPLRKPRPPPTPAHLFKKYTFVCSTFPTWAVPKDPLLKNIRFFVIFSSKIPLVFQWGAVLKVPPPIFSEGPLPKPPPIFNFHNEYPPPRGNYVRESARRVYDSRVAYTYIYCSCVFLCFPLIQKYIKKFSSTQSIHHSENTKINLITVMKQRRVLLTKHTTTAGQKLCYTCSVYVK